MLSDVLFDDCRLDLAGLRMAKLERVVFRECRMAECDLSEASLTDVLFENCELREATYADKANIVERLSQTGHPSVRAVLTAFLDDRLYFRNDNQKLLAVHPFTSTGRYIVQTANLGAIVEGAIQVTGVSAGEGSTGTVIVRLRVER